MVVLFHCFIFLIQENQMCTGYFFLFYIKHFLSDPIYFFILFLFLYSKSLMRLLIKSLLPWILCNFTFTHEMIFIFFSIFLSWIWSYLILNCAFAHFCPGFSWIYDLRSSFISKNVYLEMFKACWSFITVFLCIMFGFLENILIS